MKQIHTNELIEGPFKYLDGVGNLKNRQQDNDIFNN